MFAFLDFIYIISKLQRLIAALKIIQYALKYNMNMNFLIELMKIWNRADMKSSDVERFIQNIWTENIIIWYEKNYSSWDVNWKFGIY